ncbi:MAG TPA: sulfite exporter TauE/SafE family protein [Spongiibacteraceae bacterium]|jgi:hypothetical protein
MTIDLALFGSALLLGFVGSTHCVGMCGGISATLGAAGGANNVKLSLSYNVGRVLCYTLLGAIVGGSVELLTIPVTPVLPQIGLWLRSLAGLLVIAMGLYVAGWWSGLTRLEAIGKHLWRHVQPLTRKLLPPRHAGSALLLGALWGLLPCGMVYSSLSWTAMNGTALGGAEWMAAFGIGTLPAMMVTTHGGSYIRDLTRRPRVRKLVAIALIIFGASAAVLPWLHGAHSEHEHMHHAAM